jgi:zinc protease
MKRLLTVLILLPILVAACVPGAPLLVPIPTPEPGPSLDDPLLLDPAVRTGTLENGLTYYIRQNHKPANRAEVWLALNAGSVLEDDDQLGLAHFLEHMLFNGTRSFKGTELVAFLEKLGMEFGPDVNAYTSFDETVYTLQVPTDDPEMLDTAFKVLEEWAAYAALSPEEIDKERGVVIEEWRLGQENAGGRIQEKIIPLLFGASRYADRLPIGKPDVIRTAPPEAVRRFYETWYRPDLMSVIAVGDFDDMDAVEAQIRERFGALPAAAAAEPRGTFDVPPQEGTASVIATDPEMPYTAVELFITEPAKPLNTARDYRALLADYLVTSMLNDRLNELRRKADAPFLSAGVDRGSFLRSVDYTSVFAQVEEEKVLAGLDAVATELERARRHGFTPTELERARKAVLRFFESAYADRDNRENAALASEYLSLFLENVASPGIEVEYALAQELIPSLTLDELNAHVKELATGENRAVLLMAPEKKDLALPAEAELVATIDAVAAKEIAPYEDSAAGVALMDESLAPVGVQSERSLPDLNVTELTLANGVRVILKPTDFQKDEVVISATSPGGNSLYDDEDYPESTIIEGVVTESGVGDLDQNQLERLLAGKLAFASPSIGELGEGFSAYASPQDLETAFQLMYLYATQPRVDDAVFEVMRTQMRNDLRNRELMPETALYDTLTEILCGKGIRCTDLPLEVVDSLDLERGLELYKERFADMSDFTFTIVGNFDEAQVRSLAQRYLGNLPSGDRKETWRDVQPKPPETVIERDVHKGIGDQSQALIIYSGPFDPTLENQAALDALESVLSIQLRDALREELSGTYAPSVSASWQRLPRPEYSISIGFGSDPKRAEELTDAAFDVIAKLVAEGPKPDDVEKAKEQERQDYEEQLEQNGFWVSALEDALTSPGGDPNDLLAWDDVVAGLTAEDVHAAAKAFLPSDRFVRVTLYPEEATP